MTHRSLWWGLWLIFRWAIPAGSLAAVWLYGMLFGWISLWGRSHSTALHYKELAGLLILY